MEMGWLAISLSIFGSIKWSSMRKMCYSAMVEADLRKLEHQGINDVRGFVLLYQMYEEMRWSTPRESSVREAVAAHARNVVKAHARRRRARFRMCGLR